MKKRVLDRVVVVGMFLGLGWAWPDAAPEPSASERSEPAVARVSRPRAPLPTRTAPDAYARAQQDGEVSAAAELSVPAPAGLGAHATVTFVLREDDGRIPPAAIITSPDCGLRRHVAGGRLTLPVASGTCTFIAQRPSGLLRHQTEPYVATLGDGEEWELALTFPPGETGGLGASLMRDPRGVRLAYLVTGGSAAASGLLQGDVIATIEDREVAAMSLDEVVRALTGPVGSIVDVALWPTDDPDSDLLPATLERVYLPKE